MNHSQNTTEEPRIIVFDTTLRDGDQSPGYAMTIEEKRQMAHALAAMKIDVIEAGFPASSSYDFRSVKVIAEQVRGPRIAALARATTQDINAAAAALENCPCPRIHTFIATSDDHMAYKLRKTPEQVLSLIQSSVGQAYTHMAGRGDVEWSAEDASRSSIPFLVRAVRVAIAAGATTINLPDTVGAVYPDEYQEMFHRVIAEVKPAPHIVFSSHAHNDQGFAVVNSLAALHGGARQVESTVKGIGERAGNAQMEAVVANILSRHDRNPYVCTVQTERMVQTAALHTSFFANPPSILPVVGDNAFAHGSGIHQGGMVKGGSYEHLNSESFGRKGSSFPLTRHSGEAGICAVLNHHGVEIPKESAAQFVHEFKETAAQLLERKKLRIVPPELVVQWAQEFVSQRQKGAHSSVSSCFFHLQPA